MPERRLGTWRNATCINVDLRADRRTGIKNVRTDQRAVPTGLVRNLTYFHAATCCSGVALAKIARSVPVSSVARVFRYGRTASPTANLPATASLANAKPGLVAKYIATRPADRSASANPGRM